MKTLKTLSILLLSLFISIGFTGCKATQNANNKQKGAVIGAASGAILGAIIGEKAGKGEKGTEGAVIGGIVGGTVGVLIGNRMDKQAQKIEEEIPGATVERVDDGIVVTFDENSGVYFDTNKFNINADSQITLDKLIGILKENPDTNVLVVGHTDSVGAAAYNMELSRKRAQSVTDYFISKGLMPTRFETSWYGETKPVNDNNTAEGRAKNRRVNVVIVPNEKMKEDAKKEVGKE